MKKEFFSEEELALIESLEILGGEGVNNTANSPCNVNCDSTCNSQCTCPPPQTYCFVGTGCTISWGTCTH